MKKQTAMDIAFQDFENYWEDNEFNKIDKEQFEQKIRNIGVSLFKSVSKEIKKAFKIKDKTSKEFIVLTNEIYIKVGLCYFNHRNTLLSKYKEKYHL